jgi:hypothetical protein
MKGMRMRNNMLNTIARTRFLLVFMCRTVPEDLLRFEALPEEETKSALLPKLADAVEVISWLPEATTGRTREGDWQRAAR